MDDELNTVSKPEGEGGDPVVKSGARHSKADMELINSSRQMLREIDANLVTLGAEDEQPEEPETTEPPEMEPEKMFIAFGGSVKATPLYDGRIRVGGYLVRFSTEDDHDLSGEYFTKNTDYGFSPGEDAIIPVYFHHTQPLPTRDGRKITIKKRIGRGTLEIDDVGVLIDAILYNREEYEMAIASNINKLGWSSGALGHIVEKEPGKKANWIKRWPIGEGSLTPTPAEPRNGIVPLKSLFTAPEAVPGTVAADNQPVKALRKDAPMEITEETLKGLITEAAKTAAEEALKSMPAPKAGANVSVVKDAADQPFESAGEFFQAVKTAALFPQHADPRLGSLDVRNVKGALGINETVPAEGGYLVPQQTASSILENVYGTGKITSLLNPDPVTGNNMTYNAIDETSRVDGSRLGGVIGYWRAEAAAITASNPKWRQIELKLKSVYALCYATDEQLRDTRNLDSWLTRTVPDELRFKVEDGVYEGDGVGKPLGFMLSPALISVPRYATSAINYVDILAMWARRWGNVSDYVWFVNQDVTPQLDAMVLSGSTEIPLRFVDYGADGAMRMKGRPVVEVEYASTLGTAGDIVLASMSQYLSIQAGGIETATSMHVQFLTAQQAFRFGYRFDGAPAWHSALTPFKGSNTQSPFVCLSAATA